eukprot:363357-Chlamydomonas_euryale.AAC.13
MPPPGARARDQDKRYDAPPGPCTMLVRCARLRIGTLEGESGGPQRASGARRLAGSAMHACAAADAVFERGRRSARRADEFESV